MSLRDEALELQEGNQILDLQSKLDKKTSDLRTSRRQETRLRERITELETQLDVVHSIKEADAKVPRWLYPKKRYKKHRGTPVLFLSDLHFDEVIDSSQVDGMNAYNRVIAQARLERVINNVVDVTEHYMGGLEWDGLVVPLGGDIFAGSIHEELMQTNEGTIMESIVYWVEQLASALEYLADRFEQVFIPCVVGNHDRSSRKPVHKRRARESYGWVIYHWLADHFRDDSRVKMLISDAADMRFPVYDTKFLLTHGDQFRGGNGIAGIWSPILRGAYKKQQREASLGRPFDYMIMGHWHQLSYAPGVIINGSLKGYDEYAYTNNFQFERPQQALWVVTPENRITMQTSVFADSKKEKW